MWTKWSQLGTRILIGKGSLVLQSCRHRLEKPLFGMPPQPFKLYQYHLIPVRCRIGIFIIGGLFDL
jgi:hypothetical protein